MKNEHTQPYAILMCGPNASGKTTFAQALITREPSLNLVNGEAFRHLIKEEVAYLRDVDYSRKTPQQKIANSMAKDYLISLTGKLAAAHQSLLIDATNLRASTRSFRLDQIKEDNPDVVTIVVAMDIPEEILRARLQERDDQEGSQYLKNYDSFGASTYELPSEDEADHVFLVNEENQDEILEKLDAILNS